jgi:hypothetical protein
MFSQKCKNCFVRRLGLSVANVIKLILALGLVFVEVMKAIK